MGAWLREAPHCKWENAGSAIPPRPSLFMSTPYGWDTKFGADVYYCERIIKGKKKKERYYLPEIFDPKSISERALRVKDGYIMHVNPQNLKLEKK